MTTSHLITRRTGSGLEIFYGLGDKPFRLEARRTAIGTAFPEGGGACYYCVVAERAFSGRDPDTPPALSYAVVFEGQARGAEALYAGLIEAKDRYLCEIVACPREPAEAYEGLRDLEGLTWYSKASERELRGRFPSFVAADQRAGVVPVDTEPEVAVAGIGTLLAQNVLDPDTRAPLLDAEGGTVPGLLVFSELDTHRAAAALSRLAADEDVLTVLHRAVKALQNSAPIRRKRLLDTLTERQGSKFVGY